MELTLNRFAEAEDYTYGLLYEEGNRYPLAFTLEDEFHVAKIKGETRIPEGRYEVKLNPVITPLTQKYRNRFSWFSKHIQILAVENYQNVYIHIGNTDENTEGCVLLADTCDLTPPTQDGFIGESVPCFERFYKKTEPVLRLNKEKVFINIKNI